MADERLSETWMWQRAQALLDQADRLQRQFFQLGPGGGERAAWEPPADVFETERAFLVVVALPGVAPESIEVLAQAGAVLVRGERAQPDPCRTAAVRRMEIPHGRFQRRIQLGAEALGLVRRELRDGCLFLELEKQAP